MVRTARNAIVAIAILLLAAPNTVLAQGNVWAAGVGMSSCGTWLSTPDHEFTGGQWALGYWTARNTMSATPGTGHSTDMAGILGEIKIACRSSPSTPLYQAVHDTYDLFASQGR
ncbi:MAG TPA: hypothetical protein DF282_21440 [Hyphomonas sp.]|nr:hypothetical protein [Hyphomonas sp.]